MCALRHETPRTTNYRKRESREKRTEVGMVSCRPRFGYERTYFLARSRAPRRQLPTVPRAIAPRRRPAGAGTGVEGVFGVFGVFGGGPFSGGVVIGGVVGGVVTEEVGVVVPLPGVVDEGEVLPVPAPAPPAPKNGASPPPSPKPPPPGPPKPPNPPPSNAPVGPRLPPAPPPPANRRANWD